MTTITNETFHTLTISQQPTTTTANVSQQPGNRNNVEPEENRNPENQARPDCCTQRINMCCFAINPPNIPTNIPQIAAVAQGRTIAQWYSALSCNCFD